MHKTDERVGVGLGVGVAGLGLESDSEHIFVEHLVLEHGLEGAVAKCAFERPRAISCILFDCYISRIKDYLIFLPDEGAHIVLSPRLHFVQFQFSQPLVHPMAAVALHPLMEVILAVFLKAFLH